MTQPSPELAAYMTLVRRRVIRAARDHSWTLAQLNAVLVSLNLTPYRTADLVGSCVVAVQLDPADPTPRPSAAQARVLMRVQAQNSPLNDIQVGQWQGFEFVSFNAGTQVLRVQVFLIVQRTAGTIADVESAVRAAVSVVPYSPLVVLPAFTGQQILSFSWDAADPDDAV